MIPLRDIEYIENRLIAPAPGVLEAVERLRKHGHEEEAAALMRALKAFTNECRAVRQSVVIGAG